MHLTIQQMQQQLLQEQQRLQRQQREIRRLRDLVSKFRITLIDSRERHVLSYLFLSDILARGSRGRVGGRGGR